MIEATQTVGLVQQFIERTGQLYSLPAAAAEVLRLTSEPRIDVQALKKCLESDPALAARILRVVNSSLFGPSRQVTDLNQALTLLGIRPLKMLVLGFSLPKELFAGLEAEVLSRYWRQTLIKAIGARELCEKLWHMPGDEAFLAGLVQDIGMLVLIQHLGSSYQRLLGHVQSHGGSLLAQELDALGFDHLVLSARLLGHWGLPAGLCAAISIPPDEARINELVGNERMLPRILHLADLLARLIDQPPGNALSELLDVGSRYCELTYDTLQPIVTSVEEKVSELARVLSLQLPDDRSYVDLLVMAQERLAAETFVMARGVAAPDAEDQLLSLAGELRTEMALAARPRPVERPADQVIRAEGNHETRATSIRTDIGLSSRVTAALARCRQARTALTLAVFEIDHFNDLVLQIGPSAIGAFAGALKSAIGDWTGQRNDTLRTNYNRLAILLHGCARNEGVRLARSVLTCVGPWSRDQFGLSTGATLSIGLATLESVPKNFPASDFIEGCQRCLSAAQLSGGNTVKSIEF
jgi:HD-like signal output (HDOD) protein